MVGHYFEAKRLYQVNFLPSNVNVQLSIYVALTQGDAKSQGGVKPIRLGLWSSLASGNLTPLMS